MNETIELDLLATFVTVVDAGNFTRAAKRLHTTKATVSRAIARLEEQVGAELIHRTTRRVAASTAGQALYERAVPHVVALRSAVRELPEAEALPSGELRITAPVDLGTTLLPDVLARFTLRYPDVRVSAQLSNENYDLVAEGFDLAIRAAGRSIEGSSLTTRRLVEITSGAYAAPSYLVRRGSPRALGDEEHEWILHEAVLRGAGARRALRPRLTTNDFYLVRDVVKAGVGVGVLPSFLAAPLVAEGTLVRVLPTLKSFRGRFVLLYPSSGQVARKVTAFKDVLLETLEARPLPS